ncbi:MAG: efflux RND transporter periplasmic adaptor subunit [Desulfobacterales bacterium]|nr:efflux RND transporter periplasmic adaptor subunit [Desulfobacterales bacterium]
MKKFLYAFLLLVLLGGAFLAGSWFSQKEPSRVNPSAAKSPTVNAPEKPDIDTDTSPLPPGTIRITPEKQQVIGVRTGVVGKAAVQHLIRTVGRIVPDEKRVYRLVAGIDGWIRETYDNDTGTLVKKDERLSSFYSPQFRAAQIAYLSILGAGEDRFQAGGRQALAPSQQASVSLQTYIDALESLGMSEQQMKELASTRQITDKVFIMAPVTGFIIARNVSPGQRFEKGTEWYRIADLSRVWVLADLFRNEAEYVRSGMKVRVTIPETKRTHNAVVSTVLPQFDATSRTLKVRLELENPGYTLRPDMFVDVEFPVTLPSALTVPTDAILDSGLKKTVFVDQGNGMFEPREVETGWRLGNRVEITKGLMPGDRIAMSGTFLIDSESRMELAAAGMVGTLAKDPVCGVDVSVNKAAKAGRKSKYKDVTYYFSSDECKQKFDKSPQHYIRK